MKTITNTLKALGAVYIIGLAMLGLNSCQLPGAIDKNPTLKLTTQIATDVGLQLLAAKLREDKPESAEAILVLLRAVQAETFSGPGLEEGWPKDSQSQALKSVLNASMDSRLEPGQQETALQAVINGLANRGAK